MKRLSVTHPTSVQACQAHSRGDLATATRLYRVYGEQGLGDTLQFVRYLPQVARVGNTSS